MALCQLVRKFKDPNVHSRKIQESQNYLIMTPKSEIALSFYCHLKQWGSDVCLVNLKCVISQFCTFFLYLSIFAYVCLSRLSRYSEHINVLVVCSVEDSVSFTVLCVVASENCSNIISAGNSESLTIYRRNMEG